MSNESKKLFVSSLTNLKKLLNNLTESKNPTGAEVLQSLIYRIETFGNTYLTDGAQIPDVKTKHDSNFMLIQSLWKKQFPNYGLFSGEDKVALSNLISNILSVVYPQANAVFLENCIANFANSNVEWLSKYRNFTVFARNFRSFVDGPVRERSRTENAPTMRSDGF